MHDNPFRHRNCPLHRYGSNIWPEITVTIDFNLLLQPMTSSSFTCKSSPSDGKGLIPTSAVGIFLPILLTRANRGQYARVSDA